MILLLVDVIANFFSGDDESDDWFVVFQELEFHHGTFLEFSLFPALWEEVRERERERGRGGERNY